ncbi:hypothetical protein [Epilithonimonas xixisoli]|uniref:Uncharacterized protein n=1 Tax=Epilithonimonas xixisoli TaxID=1476462 RepID=A0A4R8I7G6_9FLAO|nr:hypothetical protein [Epilithonimonas xixisoli]TDX84599.1 hypothetical protein B0I22_2228 [Epilithonimonas xixisoli]
MKPIKLPFEIGKEYENWEFDLEISDFERIRGYDSYFYIKKIDFLTISTSYIELVFSWDILQAVIIIMSFDSLEQLKEFEKIISLELGEYEKSYHKELKGNIFIINNIELLLTHPLDAKVFIVYGKNNLLISSIYNSLLF